MSDDTPTRPYEPADESRTEILPAAASEPGADQGPDPSRRRLILVVAIAGGVALLAIIITLAVLLGRPAAAPAPTASPTSTSTSEGTPIPTPTPTLTPAPDDDESEVPSTPPAASIVNFFAWDDEVDCSGDVAVPISLQWEATGERLWLGVGTEDAQQQPYGEYPLSHTLDLDYQCGQPSGSQIYTVTVQAADGTTASSTVTITEAPLVVP
ncbi:hypothetical protein HDC94_002208 [Leifsonia sp. AK011]|uniref:hypothetical protein n=1 Tax=Leifsonia sp. AK011 TaxID=2723075 RepID=UPI0015CBE712|nr:hypothetical protein [Leifsonia sp. AK011]NYF11052.1 hypothetical protein [Leifsonia sp. AK011]